jgi:uncharacterized membrane protein YhhN
MASNIEKRSLILYFLAAGLNIRATLDDNLMLVFMSKPLLLSCLFFAWSRCDISSARFKNLIAAAFAFSWLGDVLLMMIPSAWGDQAPFFVMGLLSFLVAHVCFIAAFEHWRAGRSGLFWKKPWFALPLFLFVGWMIYTIWPQVGALRIPVLAYSLVLASMSWSAQNLWGVISKKAYAWLVPGTILFVISDSLIALNKFGQAIPNASFLIMATYILAQYLIYQGAKQYE